MDLDSLLEEARQVHKANCLALAEAHALLTRAAELLNRQIQLLGGSSAWMVSLVPTTTVGDARAHREACAESVLNMEPAALQEMSVAELARHLEAIKSRLYPFQDSTLVAVSALRDVVEVLDTNDFNAPSMRRFWGNIDASLVSLLEDSRITPDVRAAVCEGLQLIRQRNLSSRLDPV